MGGFGGGTGRPRRVDERAKVSTFFLFSVLLPNEARVAPVVPSALQHGRTPNSECGLGFVCRDFVWGGGGLAKSTTSSGVESWLCILHDMRQLTVGHCVLCRALSRGEITLLQGEGNQSLPNISILPRQNGDRTPLADFDSFPFRLHPLLHDRHEARVELFFPVFIGSCCIGTGIRSPRSLLGALVKTPTTAVMMSPLFLIPFLLVT